MEVTIDVLEILELSSSLGVRELNRIETGIGERGVLNVGKTEKKIQAPIRCLYVHIGPSAFLVLFQP